MKIEVFCDESSQEVLKDKTANHYMVLGSVWFLAERRISLKEGIKELKLKNNYRSEIKWNKVAPSTLDFYLQLVDWFFSQEDLRSRFLIVNADEVNLVKFHNDDSELSFYKFYYQLLHHWILDYNEYRIFLDHKTNKDRNRVIKLNEVLSSANYFSNVAQVQSLPSHESLGIQLADFLMGAVNGKFNSRITSIAKQSVIERIEQHLKHPIKPTSRSEQKFNVFRINLQGDW